MAESSQDDAKLDLKVRDGNGAVTHFKVKKSTKFRKILTARCGVTPTPTTRRHSYANDAASLLRQRRGIIQSTQAYAGKAGINPDTIRMMVDGQRVNLEQCPGDYDMESGDQIDAMAEQQGGLGQDPAAAAVAAALRDNLARQAQIEAALERLRSVMAATLREREALKRQLIARGAAAPSPTTAPPQRRGGAQ